MFSIKDESTRGLTVLYSKQLKRFCTHIEIAHAATKEVDLNKFISGFEPGNFEVIKSVFQSKNSDLVAKLAMNIAKGIDRGPVQHTTYTGVVCALAECAELPYSVFGGFGLPKTVSGYEKAKAEYESSGAVHAALPTHTYVSVLGVDYEIYTGFDIDTKVDHFEYVELMNS